MSARFVIKKRIFSIEHKYCLHFPRFSFSDSGFFSCSQTKSQGSASRYIVCISSYPEQVEFSSVCMCQHFSFLHFLRRLDKRTFFIRVAWFEVRSEGTEKKGTGHSRQLGAGAKVDQATNDGCTPLFAAAQNGKEAVARLLLDSGANANICMTVNSCHSPLTIAAYMGHGAVCELLLAHNADALFAALAKDSEPFLTVGGSAADLARERGHGPLGSMLDSCILSSLA